MLNKALEVLKFIESKGYTAYLVGGFVRDFVLGKTSADVDVCTNATPKDLQNIFPSIKVPFERYGSVNVIYKKTRFDITTFRMDLEYKDNRFPSNVVYSNDLLVDLKRRDFTMNTLCMNSNGMVLDLLSATKDINNKIIKTVGLADEKISEDALRILRAIRFATILNFKLDIDLKNAILKNKKLLDQLSYFRKKQELNKIFSSTNVIYGLELIEKLGLSSYLGISFKEVKKTNDPLGIWVQVNPSDKYQFTNSEKGYMRSIKRILTDKVIDNMELYNYGNYVCYIAAQILGIEEVTIYEKYDDLPIKSLQDIMVKPFEIIDLLNMKDKSKLKVIMEDLKNKILLGKLKNTKKGIIKYLVDTYC